MLDSYGLATMIYDVFAKRKEAFAPFEPITSNKSQQSSPATWNIVSFALSFLIGLFAFYLSWSCNTALGYNIIIKTIFGVFAFLFGLIYIILYIIFRLDTCAKIMKF